MRVTAWLPVIWLAVILSNAPAASAPRIATLGATGADSSATIALFPESPNESRNPTLRVLDRSDADLRLEFECPALVSHSLTIGDESFQVLEIEGGGTRGGEGQPMLPTFSRLIQIPDRAGVSIEITAVDAVELNGIRPFPMQPNEPGSFVIDRAAYARAGFGDAERAALGEPAIARDLRVVPITFAPVRYDAARGVVEAARRIEVTVRFAGVDLRNAMPVHHPTLPPSFDALYRQLVVNYGGPRDGQPLRPGTYVMIYPEAEWLLEELQPLIDWRTRKGFEVVTASTLETGTTWESIRAWLQNAYDTWENPPEYVTLIGDADGWLSLPCGFYGGGETDHYYVQLSGDDVLPEAHIGRISVADSGELALYIHKVVSYESTPYLDETSWYTRACAVGDPGASGITCVQVMQWLKERLLAYGYAEVDTVFAAPFVSRMRTALNRGDTVFSYRGYYGHSGWTTGDIRALQNGRKMPFAVSITCGTGDFYNATSYSEAWIRAGSPPDFPTGAIASVGTSTLATHTRYNNCVTYGIWRGILAENLYTFGEALTRAKLELYINYMPYDPTGCYAFTFWNNLMGDPGGEIWTGVPEEMVATHPSALYAGASSLDVRVMAAGVPLAGATVCAWKEGEAHAIVATDAAGCARLAFSPLGPGGLELTVTRHDYRPILATIAVAPADAFLGYSAHRIDDDSGGTSGGNADGVVNPNERIELALAARNFGALPAEQVTGILGSDDPYVTLDDAIESFGDIPAGSESWCADDFDFHVDGGAPDGHVITFDLTLSSAGGAYSSRLRIPVVAPDYDAAGVTVYDAGERIDPGERARLSIRLLNHGGCGSGASQANLTSTHPWLTVIDALGQYPPIPMGSDGENLFDRFEVQAASECLPGWFAPLALEVQTASGARDTVQFNLQIGVAAVTDPTGPDNFGYLAYDDSDVSYPQAPVYEWIELAPDFGGPGIDVGLDDPGGENDDSRVVDLPFPFRFYNQLFTRATICSNGWLALGETHLTNRRNWHIPGAGAPPNLIAPMWDNLYESGSRQVYHWFDEQNHRYVVQWARMYNDAYQAVENFELILYDPAYDFTPSGDGDIVFQYDTFNNTDSEQHYCTIGIENGDQTDGLQYSYFNAYNAGARPVASGRAIRFSATLAPARGELNGTITNATDGSAPLPGATVRLLECGDALVSGADGRYGGRVHAGQFTVVASHPSFAADTVHDVVIPTQGPVERNFALNDILPPWLLETTRYPNTGDDAGPYEISTRILEFSSLAEASLHYNVNGMGWVGMDLTPAQPEFYHASISGQPYGSRVKYYLYAEDAAGLGACDPANAPWESYEFVVIEPVVRDDFEIDSGVWSHYSVTDGFVDQWHRSVERNHTPAGTYSWKQGDPSGGYYSNRTDAALEVGPLAVDRDATLTFWHWMDAQISGSYPGYAYDGGLLELSVDGGPWIQIDPEGGYPYRIRQGSVPGPFAPNTPVFSGTFDWSLAQFALNGIQGDVRMRFRFGTDGSATRLGWFIDDVQILPQTVPPANSGGAFATYAKLALHSPQPNPAGPWGSVAIRWDMSYPAPVRVAIVDVTGRLVRSLLHESAPSGRYSLNWDLRDSAGRRVENGMYDCVLECGGKTLTRRVAVVR